MIENMERVVVSSEDSTSCLSEHECRALLRLYERTVATMPSSLIVLDKELDVLMANEQSLEVFNQPISDVIGKNIVDVLLPFLLAEQSLLQRIRTVAIYGGEDELRGVLYKSGSDSEKYFNMRICGIRLPEGEEGAARLLMVMEDVTESQRLEEKLQGVARIEAIGRLAGGVAHDFNNLITGIKGYTELLLKGMSPDSYMRSDLAQIGNLADHAAELTRQLLAVGRRQPLMPRVLNLNDLIQNTIEMLQRLIGESIEVTFLPEKDLGSTRIDPVQFKQVLMNLVINARDAMTDSGRLTVETMNTVLDQNYADQHPGVCPGPYVMLAVTDTGEGMDDETRQQIFDPFFTTKGVGKGTGLGLSTVYGIVKQHGGNIWVYSEPGRGTTFKIYLPRVDMKARELIAELEKDTVPQGTETVLVVEDKSAVRDVIDRLLTMQGYTTVSVGSPREAESAFTKRCANIDLLLTDIVLPDCNGQELYGRLKAKKPHLKVLYMSGYTESTVVQQGQLEANVPFIQKPFQPDNLARRVREVLDEIDDREN